MKQPTRRSFIQTGAVAGGSLFVNPVTLFSNPLETIKPEIINKKVYKSRDFTTEVLVAGGGMTGISAAISAARNGAKVILVHDRSRLGGNASSEIRMHICGASIMTGKPWRETGILEELVLTESVTNPQRSFEMWDLILYDKVISEPNITLLLDTVVFEVETEKDRITSVSAVCSPTEEIFDIKSEYFIDCTGDGSMAAQAGAEYMRGREGRDIFNESLAGDKSDNYTMGNSLLFFSRNFESPMPFNPPAWAKKYSSGDFAHRRISSWEYGYWWIEIGGLGDTIKDGHGLRHELLSIVMGVWDYIKNSGEHPDSENWALTWVGMIPGKRESRRITGDHILVQQEVQSPVLFSDRVAYGGWPLDDHPPEGMGKTSISPFRSISLKQPYSIPLRSLYSRNMGNLFMAGRNLSASHVALSSSRVMATCSALGQAVGAAAAECLKENISPKQLATDEKHITHLQQILLRQDQSLLGVLNSDPDDLARRASVKASSQTDTGKAENMLDGINRDIDDGKCHQWQAEMAIGNPWIELNWDKPVTMNQMQLTFDTGARRHLRLTGQDAVYKNQIRGPQPECVSDFIIEAHTSGGYREIKAVKGNYLRRVVLNFNEISTDSIKISVQKSNGDSLARIFEIRCYNE
ncbi:MAG: FAD-dependent oxidoreductase [Bacteroidota bacterium]